MAFAKSDIQQFLRDEIRSQRYTVNHSKPCTTSIRKFMVATPNTTTQDNFKSERIMKGGR